MAVQQLQEMLQEPCFLFTILHCCREMYQQQGVQRGRSVLAHRRRLRPDWLFLFSCLSREPSADRSAFTSTLCQLLQVPGLRVEDLAKELRKRNLRSDIQGSLEVAHYVVPPRHAWARALAWLILALPLAIPAVFVGEVPDALAETTRAVVHNLQHPAKCSIGSISCTLLSLTQGLTSLYALVLHLGGTWYSKPCDSDS